MKKWIFLLIGLFPATLASADYFSRPPAGKVIVGYQQDWATVLNKVQGVQVIETGDHVKVILGVDSFFKPNTTNQIFPPQSQTLSQVAQLVSSYGRARITITGFTDDVGSDAIKFKRSLEQANAIAAYFWAQGIPLRRMTVIGCGDTYPVSTNKLPNGSAANRRIEIETQSYSKGCTDCG